MAYMVKRWKMIVILVLSLLLTGLAYVGSLLAQIKEEEIDFEVMATVTAKGGDSLWDLAQKYYGDPFKWTIIKDVNKIPNEYTIPVGTVMYIPVIPLKKTVKVVEPEIKEEKPPAPDERLLAEIEKLREELSRIKGDLEICKEQNDELRKELQDKDATIKDLSGMLDNIKAALDKMKADTES